MHRAALAIGIQGASIVRGRQCTRTQVLSETRLRRVKSLRAPRKLFDGAGLYILVAPNGGRYWRYNYRFNGKEKTLSLGIYPEVSLTMARSRHQEARRLLADGIEPPSIKKQAFGMVARKQVDV